MYDITSSYITPNWNAPKNVKAITTIKPLDFSFFHYKDRNLDEQNKSQIKQLFEHLNIPYDVLWLKQVHGTKSVQAETESVIYKNNHSKNFFDSNFSIAHVEADASFSFKENLACVVLTADCLPILITNKQGNKVAAIHAGWRGLVNGIIENTITSMDINSKDLLVWLGPAISKMKFEVGEEVKEIFLKNAKNKNLVTNSFKKINKDNAFNKSSKQNFKLTETNNNFFSDKNDIDFNFLEKENNIEISETKYLADIYSLAKDRLYYLDINPEQIFSHLYCTASHTDNFYSYRRDKTTSRMASIIWFSN